MKTYESIVKGETIPKPGVPESFRVLVKELQALGLDLKVLDAQDQEIELLDDEDDNDVINFNKLEKFKEEQMAAEEKRIQEEFGEEPVAEATETEQE